MITDKQFKKIADRVMALPGMRVDHNSTFMAEPNEEGVDTYIKFMSDHGITDDHNGTVLKDYFIMNGCPIRTLRPRSMVVLDESLKRLFLP